MTLEINELKQKFYDNVWKFEQSKVKNLHSHFFKLPKILIFRTPSPLPVWQFFKITHSPSDMEKKQGKTEIQKFEYLKNEKYF